jgi:imidazolonepropionase-like amidohydrolase
MSVGHRAAVTVVALVVPVLITGTPQAADLALVGGTVITVADPRPINDGVVLIDATDIVAVGPRAEVEVSAGTRVLDTSGRFIIPGLIDTNVHLILMTVPEFYVKYEDRLKDIALQSAQIGLKYGMTTMADTWGPLDPLLEARDRISRGEVVGSHILVAATGNGSEALGLEDRIGTLERGKRADLLVLDADPLEDIANLRKIRFVIKDGEVVDRDALPTVQLLDFDPEAEWPY